MSSSDEIVRSTTRDDVKTILRFIKQKAEFDISMKGFSGAIETSEQSLLETLFSEMPYAHAVLAESAGTVNGFALYYFRYSSFKGRPHLWLEDLLVTPESRSNGIGQKLMKYLAVQAINQNCSHMAWTVSINNTKGIQFYERLGAKVQEKNNKRHVLSLDEHILISLGRANKLFEKEH
ncbi:hypothetical protein MNBD_UNCLBAC01-2144 [hydrothermal vent metagenome]|uniref:N-acetyltransferase domain-containing protein n=1 Tax=hydrothermal vent metagenome TaxID=652676 RepID=A0A3B1DGZ5_9ZZZZ